MATYTETIELDDGVSGPAKGAADAVARLGSDVDKAKASVTGLGKDLEFSFAAAAKGATAAAGAVAAFATATAGAIAGGVALAISANDAKGDLIQLFGILGEGAVTGEEALGVIDKLGAEFGKTRDELAPLAQAFATMGVTGVQQLEDLTRAAASAGALAKGGGQAFEQMFRKVQAAAATGQALKVPLKGLGSLASMGLKVDDVAQAMGVSAKDLGDQLAKGTVDAKKFGDALQNSLIKKGAGPLADNAADIENTWKRAKESVAKMFEDIDTAPFLGALKDLVGTLDKGTPSGAALSAAVGGFFREVFAVLTVVVPMVKHFFLDMIIYGLQAYIALKPIAGAIADFAKSSEGMMVLQGMAIALKAVASVAAFMVVSFAAVVGLFAGMTAGAVAASAAVLGFVSSAATTLASWVAGAGGLASSFVDGLAQGITAGAAKVIAAVTGLASGASGAFKAALGIKSPSTVMVAHGGNVAAGAAVGIEEGTPAVASAATGMATAAESAVSSAGVEAASPALAAPPSASPGEGGGRGSVVVNLASGAIVVQGGGGESALELTEAAIAILFERVAMAQGVA